MYTYIMCAEEMAFVPGKHLPSGLPFERFLPPLPAGMVQSWLEKNIRKGDWIIDPFGSTAYLPIEAAKAGYRIVTICNNPILQFMLKILAAAPQKSDFLAALADLAKEKRENERLENHLKALYATECPTCKQVIYCDSYHWKKDEEFPVTRYLHCPYCKTDGEFPIGPIDRQRLNLLSSDALHRSRALERINISELAKESASEALQVYLPRPLYFLFTLINRVERMQTTELNRQLLNALLLVALDEGNTLWSWPASRSRPRQLSIPPQFREKNLWNSLEEATDVWSSFSHTVEITEWPSLPGPNGGICLFRGRIKEFLTAWGFQWQFQAAVSVLPRPNQAFWTLSALWSGWLWGKGAMLPLKGGLERRRYDWNWYSIAVHGLLNSLRDILLPENPFWGIIPEVEPGFLASTIIAAESAGWHLKGFAQRTEHEISQCYWIIDASRKGTPRLDNDENCIASLRESLLKRGEPGSKMDLFAPCLVTEASERNIPVVKGALPYSTIKSFQQRIQSLITDPHLFTRYEAPPFQSEGELWWLNDSPPLNTPSRADQTELELIEVLRGNPGISYHQINEILCDKLRGSLTPSSELIDECLISYAVSNPDQPDCWELKSAEIPQIRAQDRINSIQNLATIGNKLGFGISDNDELLWLDKKSTETYGRFVVLTTCAISQVVFSSFLPASLRSIIVLPGSRSRLLTYKLQRNPHLAQACRTKWRFIKFRFVQNLAERQNLDLEHWEDLLEMDPPQFEEPTQISIF